MKKEKIIPKNKTQFKKNIKECEKIIIKTKKLNKIIIITKK